jgi:hypothetical protein
LLEVPFLKYQKGKEFYFTCPSLKASKSFKSSNNDFPNRLPKPIPLFFNTYSASLAEKLTKKIKVRRLPLG